MKKNDLDLSYLKDDELENTSSFVDLMSRSERRNREKLKQNKDQEELKEILFKDENKKVKNKKKDNKRKEQLNKIAKSEYDKPKVEQIKTDSERIYNTNRFKDFTDDVKESMYDNLEDNINMTQDKAKYGIGNILVTGIFIIASLVFYIYSILFTNIQSDDTYLLIGGLIILGMIAIFCISIVSGKILYRILSVLNYLAFIGYIIFNLLLVIGIKI